MQMMDGMNEGGRGKNRRKNRVKITIRQQAVDGEEQELDPAKLMGMNAQTIQEYDLQMARPRFNKKNLNDQNNMFAQLIQELHQKQ